MAIQALTIGDDGTLLQGFVALPSGSTIGGSTVSALGVVTSTSATAVAVGRQGATNPVLNVNANTSLVVTGVTLVGAAAGAGMAIITTSSATDESLKIDAKGAGTLTLNGTATGKVVLARVANIKAITTPVAAAGTTVANAAALGAANVVHITSDGASKGVKMPAAVLGDWRWVLNDSATAAEFYANDGGTVNGLAADASVVIPASKGLLVFATAADTLIAFDMNALATAS